MMQWLKDLVASAGQPVREPALAVAGGACGEGCGCGPTAASAAVREAELEPPVARRVAAHRSGHDRVRAEPGETLAKQLALVIDLNVCVGCHACVTSCKQWNTSGSAGPLADEKPYGADPTGTFFNRVQTYEAGAFPGTETIHFPKSCLHCQDPPCVPVCPTGASYKRKEDGIVLVDYDKCIGCKYCAWACPYGARELDEERQVMTKCTLCVDRIYDEKLPKEDRKPACVKACPTGARLFGDVKDPESEVSKAIRERGGYSLMPEWETNPANQYLPRRVTYEAGGPTRIQAKLGGMS
jgi:Fe-S-cluster-containing dehydrogenase component